MKTIRPDDLAILRYLDEQADTLRRNLGLHQHGETVTWYESVDGKREFAVEANGYGRFALFAYEGRKPERPPGAPPGELQRRGRRLARREAAREGRRPVGGRRRQPNRSEAACVLAEPPFPAVPDLGRSFPTWAGP